MVFFSLGARFTDKVSLPLAQARNLGCVSFTGLRLWDEPFRNRVGAKDQEFSVT